MSACRADLPHRIAQSLYSDAPDEVLFRPEVRDLVQAIREFRRAKTAAAKEERGQKVWDAFEQLGAAIAAVDEAT